MVLAAAVCVGGTCSGKATAKLTLTPRKGRKRSYSFTDRPVAEARRPQARPRLTLKLKRKRTASGSTPRARPRSTPDGHQRHAAPQPRVHTDDRSAAEEFRGSTVIAAASHVEPVRVGEGPASLPMASRCEPLPSGATPASLASARRP